MVNGDKNSSRKLHTSQQNQLHTALTQKRTLKPKTRYLITTLTSDRSCLYLAIAFMIDGLVAKTCQGNHKTSRSLTENYIHNRNSCENVMLNTIFISWFSQQIATKIKPYTYTTTYKQQKLLVRRGLQISVNYRYR